ncbi:radical SAM protein [Methanolobus sp. ZRKC3]|uniref:radical SAM protein n=1 Tax=Methanolobus sp. ZRKC3 TaxID=3125786 RepID=UPI003245804A
MVIISISSGVSADIVSNVKFDGGNTSGYINSKQLIHRKTIDGHIFYDKRTGVIHNEIPSEYRCDDTQILNMPTFESTAPLKVYFDPTYLCNLKCRHCITRSSPNADTKNELTLEQIKNIFNQLARVGVLEIAITGGEPFCHPGIFSIIKYAQDAGFNTTISTNGTLITTEVAKKLAELEVFETRVSFEGAQIVNDNIRGHGVYKKALKGIETLSRADAKPVARLTLSRDSENDLGQFYYDLYQAGVTKLKVAVVKNAGNASNPENKDLFGYVSDDEKGRYLQELGTKYEIEVELSSEDFHINPKDAKDRKLRHAICKNCGAGFETGYISPQGKLLPCSTMPHIVFGNLSEESFNDAWGSDIASTYRNLATNCNEIQLCKVEDIISNFESSAKLL